MDLTPAIISLMKMFFYIIPIAILVGIFKSPWFKGIIGEFIVNISAKFMLDKDEYHLVKNVTLPTEDGTTQIDQVIVSIYGCVCDRNQKYERLDFWRLQPEDVD